jgi:hypothetical protein
MFWTLALLCCAALVYFRRARRRSRIPSVPGIPLLQLKSSSRFVEQAELWAVFSLRRLSTLKCHFLYI